MHVLIIEDEPLIAMAIEDSLRGCGCVTFDFGANVEEAIAAARRRCPDLITADVELASGCGIDAVEAICGSVGIPVIFITGSADQVHARRPGSVIVAKPFDERHLREALGLALAQAPAARPS